MPSVREIAGGLLVGLSIMMLLKSLSLCFSDDIWYDELFTVGMIEHSYGDLIGFTARDVHPPLYYCIVKFFAELCKLFAPAWDTVVPAKIASLLPYFILLAYSVTLIRKRFGMFTGGFFLFCVISMPQLAAYTVEMRMYSWALLFVTAAFLHAYEAVRGNAVRLHGAALTFYGLAAAYTQYFACVAVAMVYLYVLLFFLRKDKKSVRRWLLWAALSVAGYAPWLVSLCGQLAAVRENYWILPLSLRTLGGCVKFVMKPAFANETVNVVLAVALSAVCAAVLLGAVIKLYYNGRVCDASYIAAGVGVLVGLIMFGFAASMLFRPVFVYRYMIPALGCFWLAFAVSLGVIAGEPSKAPAAVCPSGAEPAFARRYAVVAASVCVLVLCVGLRDYRSFMGEEEYKALQMEKTETVLDRIGAEDILIFNFDQVQMVVGYYVNNEGYLWYGEPETLIQEICGATGGSLDEDTEQIRDWLSQGRKVWFLGSFRSREDVVDVLRSQGIAVGEPADCLLERYWFNLYELSAG